MGLEEFEKELSAQKERHSKHSSRRDRDGGDRDRRHGHHRHHHHHHHHRSRQERDRADDHDAKRRRDGDDSDYRREDERRADRKRRRGYSPQRDSRKDEAGQVRVFDDDGDESDEWEEKEAMTAPPEENILDQRDQVSDLTQLKRDAWMEEPSALDIDYIRSRKPAEPQGQFVSAKQNLDFKIHEKEVHGHLADLQRDFESDDEAEASKKSIPNVPAQREVDYIFGDAGSSWRMTKLKAVYRQAEESGRPPDEVALSRYGSLQEFDEARQEERELDRRTRYGPEYVGLQKPSGELYQDRKLDAGVYLSAKTPMQDSSPGEKEPQKTDDAQKVTMALDPTALNKLKAEMLKAKMRNASNAAALEEKYNLAANAAMAQSIQPDVIVLNRMENRQLASSRQGEIKQITNKRGLARGMVEENDDMTIDDMLRQEKRTRGVPGGEGRIFADRIAKDTKFTDDLDYMDDNAGKLSKRVVKSDINLQNTAISDFQRMQKILDSCPLCYHEDSQKPPIAPVISLATRTFLTLPTEPELSKNGAVIVPIQHRLNLLECDDDEWEEMRNFMKSLTRFYHAQDKSVIFYENAVFSASRKGHAALNAVPLPHHLAENGPAYFKEAMLAADEEWTQHKPIIDTMALSQRIGYGKHAFRKAIPREMPYFHVFFTLDGGLGHVVEDERRWPKGDLFAREVIGGMLDRGPDVIKRQGRWDRGDRRVESFRKRWEKFDWTAALVSTE